MQTARQPRLGLDRNSSLGRFWRWWSGELVALVPLWLRQTSGSTGNALLVEISGQKIVLKRRLQEGVSEQGKVDLQAGDLASRSVALQALVNKLRKRDGQLALWLTDTQFLSKHIELPLAAAENLRQVLSFEMDRHTPFKADQVYFDFRVTRRDTQNNRLTVRLIAAPRAAVDGSLDLLTRLGMPAQAIYVADTAASGTGPGDDAIDLMPVERRVVKSTALRLVHFGLMALVAALVIAAVAIPIVQKRQALIELLPVVDRAKHQAAAADVLRHEWEKLSSEYNFALEKKQVAPPVVVQLDELSRLLPDDTWVQQFDLKGKELQIQGETVSSSKLIALFEGAKTLRDANFRSPLTKGSMPNSERFILAAEVKPLSPGALAPPVPEPLTVPPVAIVNPASQPVPAQAAAKPESGKDKPAQAAPQAVQAPQGAKPEIKPPPVMPPALNAPAAMSGAPAKPLPPALKVPDKPAGAIAPKAEGQR